MGLFRFVIQPIEKIENWPELSRAYLTTFDRRVFPGEVGVKDGMLLLQKYSPASARLCLPYPVKGFGRPVLHTATLAEREEPYLLAVEIARGVISHLRDQYATWQQAGMLILGDAERAMRSAADLFRHAVCSQETPRTACDHAERALEQACLASKLLIESYIRQRLVQRRRRGGQLPVALGSFLGHAVPPASWDRPCGTAFNSASFDLNWKSVEARQGEYAWDLPDRQLDWIEANRLVPVVAPLLEFRAGGLPDWLAAWSNDLNSLQSLMCDYVETVLMRYLSRVRIWEIASGANVGGALRMSEEHRLSLVARTLETARRIDDELQLVLRVAQPWSEYQAEGRHRLSTVQFADAIVRSNVGLTGLTLEIAMGYSPEGTAYRDRMEVSRLIDFWSTLGLPLRVVLSFPSQQRPDVLARSSNFVDDPQYREPWNEEVQAEWMSEMILLLLAKPAVVGIEWAHLSDAVPHRFPHGGLLRHDGSAKPAMAQLSKYRQCYLPRPRPASERMDFDT